MPCCVVNKVVNKSSKHLGILKKHFDVVEVDNLEKFRLLTLKDYAKKSNYEWIIWLQVKVPYGSKGKHSSSRTDEELLNDVLKKISDWVEVLINFEKSENKGKQLSLFDEEPEDELEKEPSLPEANGNWSKYYNDCNKVRKNNLMKQYSFFELCELTSSWSTYYEHDFRTLLPKSDEEMIELVKEAIVKGTACDEGHGRFDDYWWDDEYNYITRDGALSDFELIDRVRSLIRLYLVPYTRYKYVSTDLSYSASVHETSTDYRYWFDGKRINGSCFANERDLPSYDLNKPDFILWLREYFNVSKKEYISDEDVLKENMQCVFNRAYGYDNPTFDVMDSIAKAKDFKSFKSQAIASASLGNGGGSGYSLDGFSGSYDLFNGKKGTVLTVEQNKEQRLSIGRSIDGLEESTFDENRVYVYKLNFYEVLEKAYELFKQDRQMTIFDFLAA